MAKRTGVGEVEMQLLTHVGEHGPLSVKQATEAFGEEAGLARTTVQTMLERLRKKGYLERIKQDGVFHYQTRTAKKQLLQDAVESFVQKTLGGALSPFFAYLTKQSSCTPEELEELKRLVRRLEDGQSGSDDESTQ